MGEWRGILMYWATYRFSAKLNLMTQIINAIEGSRFCLTIIKRRTLQNCLLSILFLVIRNSYSATSGTDIDLMDELPRPQFDTPDPLGKLVILPLDGSRPIHHRLA